MATAAIAPATAPSAKATRRLARVVINKVPQAAVVMAPHRRMVSIGDKASTAQKLKAAPPIRLPADSDA